MKKIMIIVAACAAIVAGCTTSITAEKHAEVILPVQQLVTVDGKDQIINTNYILASGGWEASASSPLWATEALSGLSIGVHTNGSVNLSVDKYDRDLSDNAVLLTEKALAGAADLAAKIGAAIASGGTSVGAEAVWAYVREFVGKGGDPSKATVTISDGKLICTDGICEEIVDCPGGNCSE